MAMHLSGIGSSGLDTEAIIEVLVNAKKIPVDSLEAKVEEEEDLLTAWTSIETSLTSLRSKSQQLSSYLTWRQMSAESSDSDIITATAENSAQSGIYNISASQLAQSHRIASYAQASTTTDLDLNSGSGGTFQIGGETVTITGDDTLEDVRDAINEASFNMDSDKRVNATIIGTTLVLERDLTGNTDITINDDTDGILQELGVLASSTLTDFNNEIQTSEDLTASINGIDITSTKNTGVDDAVSGISFNFKDDTTSTITISHDTATVKTLIEDFISQYNETMELAKAQGSVNLSDSGDLDSFGYLQGEYLISEIQSKSRLIITGIKSNLDDDFENLSDIGIWTTNEHNQISLVDEDALDDALANHFDEVEDLFRDTDDGIMKEFDTYLNSVITPINGRISAKKDTLSTSISSMNTEIDDLTLRLIDYESELWNHFTYMETTVSSMQSEMSFLMSNLGV